MTAQLLGDLQAGHPGHLDVEKDHVGLVLPCRRGHLVAPSHLRHDLDVVLQGEQRGQAAPDKVLVVRDQHPDHAAPARVASSGTRTRSR